MESFGCTGAPLAAPAHHWRTGTTAQAGPAAGSATAWHSSTSTQLVPGPSCNKNFLNTLHVVQVTAECVTHLQLGRRYSAACG